MLNKRRTIVALIAPVLTALLMACGGNGEPPEPSIDSALDNTEWVLTSLSGSGRVEGSNMTLSFAEARVNGFARCSSYGGEYTVADEGILTIPEIETTLQLCQSPQGIMEQQDAYAKALGNAAAYRISDDHLEIANTASETILPFVRKAEFPVHPGALLGTEWQLLWWNGRSPVKG